jgi:glycosyltransferase involved in cell wall biosynthesis
VVGAFDDHEYERACRALANSEAVRGHVEFVGPATREQVLEELLIADAFVFPTAGENFGHVIAEALSMACPVVASDYTPWSPILSAGGGDVRHRPGRQAVRVPFTRPLRASDSHQVNEETLPD